jgi:hypothetical protein
MPEFQHSYHVAGNALFESSESDESINRDPRGLVLMWEEPKPNSKYIMAIDPSFGLTGWTRGNRREGDHKTDNSAIEIFRPDAIRMPVMKDGKPVFDRQTKQQQFVLRDLQVCEFAAPVDAVEIGRIANILGRMYAGSEDDQCELILESFPGPGPLTLQELLRMGYTNLWQWQHFADSIAEDTNTYGWHANARSVQLLWTRARRHLMERKAKIMSPYLADEYSNAVVDMDKMAAKSAYGGHDDRLRAANMAFWAAHRWSTDVERTEQTVTQSPTNEWQRMAPTLGESRSYRDAWAESIDGWED